MKKVLIALVLLSNLASAETFDATKGDKEQMVITWRRVDNVSQACETESRKLGNGGFGYALMGCSFWTGNQCTIITGKKTDLDTLGHETRHCFQGRFH